jgi:hypothetical protein
MDSMSAVPGSRQNLIVAALTALATALMIVAYFAPIWWVSLTAPNYPPDAFPDGIRIHFHFNGVFNGCKAAGKGTRMASEIIQKDLSHEDERYNPITDKGKDIDKGAQGLDCVHEMNTINHYVGMFPIATGAPVEKPLAKFFFAFFAVMLLAFMLPRRKPRVIVLAIGCSLVAGWMLVDQYVLGPVGACRELRQRDGELLQRAGEDPGLGRQRHAHHAPRHRRHDRRHGRPRPRRRPAARLLAAAGAGAGAAAGLLRHHLRRLAVVLRPQPASVGRLHRQALHADGLWRRQGGAVLDLFLPLLGLRAAARRHALPPAGAADPPQADA